MQIATHQPEFNIQYRTNRRSRNIRISIKSPQNVTVTSPPFTPKFLINKFVKRSQGWIEKKLALMVSQAADPTFSEDFALLFGKKYQIINTLLTDQPVGVMIEGDKIFINQISKTTSKNQLSRFLKSTARHYILERVRVLAQKMNLKYKNVWLKQQSTRWGSCSSKQNLNFNWRLIHFEPKVIDYVIIHELAHLQHMNHSLQFWQMVKKYDPQYLIHRKFLKKQGGLEDL